jgi:O-antigen ligase
MLFFFLSTIFFLISISFLKLNSKSQINMDEHRHRILVTLVFLMAISRHAYIRQSPELPKLT